MIPYEQKRKVSVLVECTLSAMDSLERIRKVKLPLESTIIVLLDTLADELKDFCAGIPPAQWAAGVIPVWAAAAFGSYFPDAASIESLNKMYEVCGIEYKKYYAPEQVKVVMMQALHGDQSARFTDEQLKTVGIAIDQHANRLYGKSPGWDKAFLFFTKRRYSELLRNVCLRLGFVFAETSGTKYSETYIKALTEDKKDISLSQSSYRARIYAVRHFLKDYHGLLTEGGSQ